MTRRLAAQLVAAVLLALASLMGATQAAAAIPTGTDCLHPPDPASPSSGVSAWIDPGPTNPPTDDPFKPGSKASVYDVYGYAGTSIVRYDDGCTSTFNIWNDVANAGQGASSVAIALTTKLYRAVMNPAFGGIFDPIQQKAAEILGNGLFLPFIALVMAAGAIYYAARSRRGDVKDAVGGTIKTFAAVAIGVACIVFPLTVGAQVDKGIGMTVSAASTVATGGDVDRSPADKLAGAAVESTTYNSWLQSTFGNGEVNAKAAAEYGPRLFKAGAYTRSEQATIDKDPSKAEALADLKREHYKEVAKEIEEKYPDVYQWVAGNRQQQQAGFVWVGFIGTMLAVGFLIYALFQIAYGMIVTRLAIGAGPAIALFAATPRGFHVIPSVGAVVMKAVLRAVYFGVGSVLFTIAAIGTILSPTNTLDPIIKMLAMLALTVALYIGARKLGLEMNLRKKQDVDRGDYAGFNEEHRLSTNETFPPHSDPSGNRSAPIDLGYVQATSRRGTAPEVARQVAHTAAPAARALGAAPVKAAKAAATGAKGAARTGAAATVGGIRGAAKGVALTAVTGGAAAPAMLTGAAKGAATGAAKSTMRQVGAAAATKAANAPRAAIGAVVYHPGASGARPGPAGRAKAGRVGATGTRVYNIYKAKAGVK